MTHLLENVNLNALGILIRMPKKIIQKKIKESLISICKKLDLGDIGYYYDPKNPENLCDGVKLYGIIQNVWSSDFNLGVAFHKTLSIFNSIDDDYSKTIIVLTDKILPKDVYYINVSLEKSKNSKIYFYTLKENEECKKTIKIDYIVCKDVEEFILKINSIKEI